MKAAAAEGRGGCTREPEGRVALQTLDKGVPSTCADATGAVGEELRGPPKVLMGGGGGVRDVEGLEIKGRGPGRHSTLGGLLGKGHWTPAQNSVRKRSLPREGLPRHWTPGSRAPGKIKGGTRWMGRAPHQSESMQKEWGDPSGGPESTPTPQSSAGLWLCTVPPSGTSTKGQCIPKPLPLACEFQRARPCETSPPG